MKPVLGDFKPRLKFIKFGHKSFILVVIYSLFLSEWLNCVVRRTVKESLDRIILWTTTYKNNVALSKDNVSFNLRISAILHF